MERSTSDDQKTQEQEMETGLVTNVNDQNQAEIHQILDRAGAANTMSNGNGNQHRGLVISIKEMVESSFDPPLSSNQSCCIYRIPIYFLKLNEEAYTPQVISIGPFHHGSKRLQTLEKLKLKYFKRFVHKRKVNVEFLVNTIKLHEERVRNCYAESIELSSDDFVKLILVDGSFLIEYFYDLRFQGVCQVNRENHINPTLFHAILLDLKLLENQLPFSALELLFSLACTPDDNYPSFTWLAIEVFEGFQDQEFPGNYLEMQPIRHFVDLTKAFLVASSKKHESNNLVRSADHLYEAGVKFKVRPCKCLLDLTRHFADLARATLLQSSKKLVPPQESDDLPNAIPHLYTASQLHDAGVKFKVSSSKCLLELKFTNGTLEIPRIILQNETETIYRNVIAFEQCHYPRVSHFTNYIGLMNFIIKTTKDADLLIRKGIIIHWLANSNSVASFFNNLDTNIYYISSDYAYRGLIRDLNAFGKNIKHTWKTTLKRDYFGTPWKLASTIAAVILLLLTLVGAICSIIQVVKM